MSDFLLFNEWEKTGEDAGHTPEHKPGIVQPFHETNTMEGSEFLDDAIRMTDQPLVPNVF